MPQGPPAFLQRQLDPTLVKFHFIALGEKKTGVRLGQEKKPQNAPLAAVGPEPTPPCWGSRTHLPKVPLPLGCSFIHFQSGWASSPFTSILLNMSNFTP